MSAHLDVALDDRLEAAAQKLAVSKPHLAIEMGQYLCQWPEQDWPHAKAQGAIFFADGCRGCLIASHMMNLTRESPWVSIGGHGSFSGDEAMAVTRRAIGLAGPMQEVLGREESDDWAALATSGVTR